MIRPNGAICSVRAARMMRFAADAVEAISHGFQPVEWRSHNDVKAPDGAAGILVYSKLIGAATGVDRVEMTSPRSGLGDLS